MLVTIEVVWLYACFKNALNLGLQLFAALFRVKTVGSQVPPQSLFPGKLPELSVSPLIGPVRALPSARFRWTPTGILECFTCFVAVLKDEPLASSEALVTIPWWYASRMPRSRNALQPRSSALIIKEIML